MAWSRRQPTKVGGVIAMVMGVVFAIGGVILSITLVSDQQELEHLRDTGQRVPGKVTATRHEEKRSRRSTSHYYYLTVSFTHPSGQPIVHEVQVEDEAYAFFSRASLGNPQQCTVIADPAQADHFVVGEAVEEQIKSKNDGSVFAALLGVGFGLMCGLAGAFSFRRAAALQAANASHYNGGYAPQGYQNPYPLQGPPQPYAQVPPYMPPQQRLQQNPNYGNQGPYRPQ
jgi:hypothetical protein